MDPQVAFASIAAATLAIFDGTPSTLKPRNVSNLLLGLHKRAPHTSAQCLAGGTLEETSPIQMLEEAGRVQHRVASRIPRSVSHLGPLWERRRLANSTTRAATPHQNIHYRSSPHRVGQPAQAALRRSNSMFD